MPATDTRDYEREFEELVRELRALPTAAPETVRERVRALGEPAQPRSLLARRPNLRWRRTLLVLAPACVLALLAAAVVHGLVSSSPPHKSTAPATPPEALRGEPQFVPATKHSADQATTLRSWRGAVVAPAPNRIQDFEASLIVRVKDVDALGDRTSEAMQVVRSYGGYVASVEQSTSAGQPGEADLVLRVPVARVQDALFRLGALGTVLEQHLSIRDLEQVVANQRRRIVQLRLTIARITQALQSSSLPADVRLRLELQRDEARRELSRATSTNKATLREAALSRIALTLTTQKPIAATNKQHTGRIERAARNAASFLAAAGSIALFLLIVVSPFALLVAAWFFGLRAYRRREERRLLARA